MRPAGDAAAETAVGESGGMAGQAVPFEDGALDSGVGQVVGGSGARDAAAYYDDVSGPVHARR